MARLACVSVPSPALQLLRRREPSWEPFAMAVVDREEPNGRVLQVNRRAWAARVRPGMRYSAALSLAPELRAGVVSEAAIDALDGEVQRALDGLTPAVEPSAARRGAYWLDARGVARRWGTERAWAGAVLEAVRALDVTASVAVGWTRFGTLAAAYGLEAPMVYPDEHMERVATREVPLGRLGLEEKLTAALERLGVRTVGEALAMPAEGMVQRFGAAAAALLRDAQTPDAAPAQARRAREAPVAKVELGYGERDATRLMFRVKAALPPLLCELAARSEGLRVLRLDLHLEDHTIMTICVRTSAPTLDEETIVELSRLELGRATLQHDVVDLHVTAEGVALTPGQLALFRGPERRSLAAAERALARVRAELGDEAVGHLEVRPGHLPEARHRFEAGITLRLPSPDDAPPRLVRRVRDRPSALPERGRIEPDGWLLRGHEGGAVVRLAGPWAVAGGWWVREVERDYYYAETDRGDLMWVFYDRRRRRWFAHGEVS